MTYVDFRAFSFASFPFFPSFSHCPIARQGVPIESGATSVDAYEGADTGGSSLRNRTSIVPITQRSVFGGRIDEVLASVRISSSLHHNNNNNNNADDNDNADDKFVFDCHSINLFDI
jgi:hypothetical protein